LDEQAQEEKRREEDSQEQEEETKERDSMQEETKARERRRKRNYNDRPLAWEVVYVSSGSIAHDGNSVTASNKRSSRTEHGQIAYKFHKFCPLLVVEPGSKNWLKRRLKNWRRDRDFQAELNLN